MLNVESWLLSPETLASVTDCHKKNVVCTTTQHKIYTMCQYCEFAIYYKMHTCLTFAEFYSRKTSGRCLFLVGAIPVVQYILQLVLLFLLS